MLGGNNSNAGIPIFSDDNRFPRPTNASNQLQLFGNLPLGCNLPAVNYFGNEHNSPMLRPSKQGVEADVFSRQQKLQFSLNRNIFHDEADRAAGVPNQNPVSTGLRLSYDDDERNSSVTSASASMNTGPSIISSLSDNIRSELDQHKKEFDHYIKTQEETLIKGVHDIKQRHMATLLSAIEKGASKRMHEKDRELETINRKNKELVERMKHVAAEAQSWCYKARYNESVVNMLKMNLQQAMQNVDQGKEGFGDSDVDDAASCIDPNQYLNNPNGSGRSISSKGNLICRACKVREVSLLLMPCRHLCLCKDCEGLVTVCPVCQQITTAYVQVYLS